MDKTIKMWDIRMPGPLLNLDFLNTVNTGILVPLSLSLLSFMFADVAETKTTRPTDLSNAKRHPQLRMRMV